MDYIEGSSPLGCTVIKHGSKLYHFSNRFDHKFQPIPLQLKCVATGLNGTAEVELESVPATVLAAALSHLEDGLTPWIDLEIPA